MFEKLTGKLFGRAKTASEQDEIDRLPVSPQPEPSSVVDAPVPNMRTHTLSLPMTTRDFQVHFENQVLERFVDRVRVFLNSVHGKVTPEDAWTRMKAGSESEHEQLLQHYFLMLDTYRSGKSRVDQVMTHQMSELDNIRECVFEDVSNTHVMHAASLAAGVAQLRMLIAMGDASVIDAGERMRWLLGQVDGRIKTARRRLAQLLLDRLEDRGCGRPSMVGIDVLPNEKSSRPPTWQIVVRAPGTA